MLQSFLVQYQITAKNAVFAVENILNPFGVFLLVRDASIIRSKWSRHHHVMSTYLVPPISNCLCLHHHLLTLSLTWRGWRFDDFRHFLMTLWSQTVQLFRNLNFNTSKLIETADFQFSCNKTRFSLCPWFEDFIDYFVIYWWMSDNNMISTLTLIFNSFIGLEIKFVIQFFE